MLSGFFFLFFQTTSTVHCSSTVTSTVRYGRTSHDGATAYKYKYKYKYAAYLYIGEDVSPWDLG